MGVATWKQGGGGSSGRAMQYSTEMPGLKMGACEEVMPWIGKGRGSEGEAFISTASTAPREKWRLDSAAAN